MSEIWQHEITTGDLSDSAQGLAIGAATMLISFSLLALSAVLTIGSLT